MRSSNRRVLLFFGVAIALAALCYWASAQAPRHTLGASSSAYFGWFGIIAVGVLWLASAVFTGDWNPLALAMGADNRLSTSKFQLLLWTACVGFVYAMVYADRVITLGHVDAITQVPQNVLIALGISVTSAVAARAITGSQVSANPDSKDVADTPSYDPSALVRNDGSSTASLTKVQLLFWTAVAVVVYLITSFHQLGIIATCAGGSCSFPDIDTTLMLFMGLGHASYIGGKLANGTTPALTGVTDQDQDGAKVITLAGTNLGSSGSILINGQVRDDVRVISWTPTSVKFSLPQTTEWVNAQKISLGVSVGGASSAPMTYVYAPPKSAAPAPAPQPRTLTPTATAVLRQPVGTPPPAPARIPAGLVPGIDVSLYQGDAINWDAVKAQGLAQFVYSRASYGNNPADNDSNFIRNHNECKRVGIAFGAYHFFVFDVPGLDQAQLFLKRIDGYTGTLCPMIDVEDMSSSGAQQVIQNLSAFTDAVERALGSKVIIYTNQNTWNTYLAGADAFSGHHLWVANMTGKADTPPAMPRGFADWKIYQYSKGKLPLLNGGFADVDLDVLKGGVETIALSRPPAIPNAAIPVALATVVYDGMEKKLKALDAHGAVLFACEARNDSVAANAYRADAGCPPGDYVLEAPETNDPAKPSIDGNDWIGEGCWFIPITGIPGHIGIGIHGGGTCATPPDSNALRPRQGWCKTENCIRLQNEDLDKLAALPIGGKPIKVVQPQ